MKNLILLPFILIPFYLNAQIFPDKIGVVLNGIGSPALEFPNVTLTSKSWESVANSGQKASTDSLGWPTEDFRILFFDHRPFNAWADKADDSSRYVVDVSGIYSLSFKGQANLTSWCDGPVQFLNKKYDTVTNTTTLDVVFPTGGGSNWNVRGNYSFFMLNFLQTDYQGVEKGVKDIQLYRPNYIHGTPQMFNTDYINGLNQFSCIRYMDFMGVANNNNPIYPAITTWQDRVLPSDIKFENGAPWEYMISMANFVNKDVWVNLPCAADSLYIVQLATLLKNHLRPNIKIYLEYSNEVWNAGDFTQYQYNYSAVLNSVEDEDIRNATPWDDRRRARRVARQVIKAGRIFSEVFGESVSSGGRIRPVFAWQGAYLPWYDDVLDWVNTAYGAPKEFLYAISVAPYFSPADSIKNKPNASPIEIVNSMQMVCDSSTVKVIKYLSELAFKYKIKHIGYESGPASNGGADMVNLDAKIQANKISEVKAMIKHNYIENWFSQNAHGSAPLGTNDLINYYGYVGRVSRYGCWGALEDLSSLKSNNFSYKYEALCELTGKCTNRPVISIVGLQQLQKINSNFTIQVNASDPNGAVKAVEFFVQNKLVGIDSVAPFSFNTIFSDTGINIIQVKAIDNDGNFTFSDGINVLVNKESISTNNNVLSNQINLFPNPSFNSKITVNITNLVFAYQYKIYDIEGRLLIEKSNQINQTFEIDLSNYANGMYQLVLEFPDRTINARMIHFK
jgi:hypothetical protein